MKEDQKEDVQDAVEGRVASVLEAKIVGDQEEAVEIVIDPAKVNEYGLSVQETFDIVRRNNVLVSAGAIDTGRGRFAIKVPGLIESVQDLMEVPLVTSEDAVVKVQDIANINLGKALRSGAGTLEGQETDPAFSQPVYKPFQVGGSHGATEGRPDECLGSGL